ncbi:hypothetical protein B0H11DRAFT_2068312 [Mycena galericulata]|nr:hypothetical protein B0H11DRAFT_2068312 [Mycena galericulata]
MSLLCASPEVLRDIVLYTVGSTPHGPPREWYSLVLCCHTLRRQLDTPAMHALLFATKFHVPTDMHALLPAIAKLEMQRRFSALKLFQRGVQCFDEHGSFTDALWVAYVMLKAEESRQMNVDQLLWAGLPELLLLFLQRRLSDGAAENHGWPLCNEANSLVIALMWLLSSESSVRAETPASRNEVMELIKPFVLAAFRYPLSNAPEWCFGATKSKNVDGLYPPAHAAPSSSREVIYFGITRTVLLPSAPIYSILCYFARLDTLVPMFPIHLSSTSTPTSSRSGPKTGPNHQDVEHFINECRTRFEPWDSSPVSSSPSAATLPVGDSSARSITPPYLHGSLTGSWMGSAIVPCLNEYRHWLTEPEAPESMDTFCRHPMYITLQEHICYDTTQMNGCVGGGGKEIDIDTDADTDASWLPTSWQERDGGIEVLDASTNCTRFYETRTGLGVERPENVRDVLITGQTDDPYANAWGAFKIVGRVRLSDGLVVLRRESIAGLGTTLLRGYMSSPQNFAGRYRAIPKAPGCDMAPVPAEWEAAFSLSKMDARYEEEDWEGEGENDRIRVV